MRIRRKVDKLTGDVYKIENNHIGISWGEGVVSSYTWDEFKKHFEPIPPGKVDDKNVCAKCGKSAQEHLNRCQFQRAGCKCDFKNYETVPICDNYKNRNAADYPDTCECGHHKTCHEQGEGGKYKSNRRNHERQT